MGFLFLRVLRAPGAHGKPCFSAEYRLEERRGIIAAECRDFFNGDVVALEERHCLLYAALLYCLKYRKSGMLLEQLFGLPSAASHLLDDMVGRYLGRQVVIYEFDGLGDALVRVWLSRRGALGYGQYAISQRLDWSGRVKEAALEQFDGIFPALEEVDVYACEVRGDVEAYFAYVVDACHGYFARDVDARLVDCVEYGRRQVVGREEEPARLRESAQPFYELTVAVASFGILSGIFKERGHAGCALAEKSSSVAAPGLLGGMPYESKAGKVPKCLEDIDCCIHWLGNVLARAVEDLLGSVVISAKQDNRYFAKRLAVNGFRQLQWVNYEADWTDGRPYLADVGGRRELRRLKDLPSASCRCRIDTAYLLPQRLMLWVAQ